MKSLKIGLAGVGTVGQGVWRHLRGQADLLASRCGRPLEIVRVSSRNAAKAESVGIPASLVTSRWEDLIAAPEIDVIVELIGGTDDAFRLVKGALEAGKHVVTANKALLAARGGELFRLAQEKKRCLLYEASVAGGIPLLQALREGLAANRILSLHGIVNGTCNYILTRMEAEGKEYAEILAEAKKLGYAEADESLDVEGWDAAHKTLVLAAIAYGFWPKMASLTVRGIAGLDRQDIAFARTLGYGIKLLAIVKTVPSGRIEISVQPTMVPSSHVLASVKGVFNAVLVRGDVVGDTLYYGRGAGGDPTASAVLSDLAALAREGGNAADNLAFGSCGLWNEATPPGIATAEEITARYYLRLAVKDSPGVLARIATVLGKRNIGISSVIQPESSSDQGASGHVPLILMIHDANVGNFEAARAELEGLDIVQAPAVSFRVEDFT
ncbi:homoserine dehydrogenase [Verrucomicrobium sp. GAS474]|uniref:homoserine dehydrogenase n=1 Tax=Verrucomicrobium sp. GAS474 TaxID=1882831 RepID=UPI00087DB6B9|nr:homoserine dehydrogenase [Verrucomicrobium sp. GAS474]SDU19881.1 homoserine dehydrogenase [Verrucomicrobium sp. GAS474]